MRTQGGGIIWDTWMKGGPFVGEVRPTGRVTVDWDWQLTKTRLAGAGNWPTNKRPMRWYQLCDDSQDEMELPPIKSISIDQSIDADAGTATIVFYNQRMKGNLAPQHNLEELGEPGYYTLARGLGPEANARWNQTFNEWCFAITPNTLLRTYQGYGGRAEDMTIQEGVEAGYLVRTGVWFVDRVKIGTDGLVTMECRDAAKLLIDQMLYPPLVPKTLYPLHYNRWTYKWETFTWQETRLVSVPGGTHDQPITISHSTVDHWYPKGATGSHLPSGYTLHGHRAADSIDGNADTFALSVGNGSPGATFAADWWEYNVNAPVDTIYVHPWAGNYTMYVSIMENGVWINEAGSIPWDNGPLYGNQPYVADSKAGIPYVAQYGVPWETAQEYRLPRSYNAQKVRITFRNPTKSPWGPHYYRSGVREFRARYTSAPSTQSVTETFSTDVLVRYDGNYKDYADIVKDLLLWAGFLCFDPDLPGNEAPHVHGNIETTGIYAEEDLPDDLFDKRPVIDPITELKETVGYITWVDQDGAFHFESPNWWQAGNFDEVGTHHDFIPEIDEKLHLTGYQMQVADDMIRSEIIIAEQMSREGPFGVVTRHEPHNETRGRSVLRGMVKPAMWSNGYFTSRREQQVMAELIALHIWFRVRQAQVEAQANPCIQINDQVRVYERITSTTFIHYVRGISTQMDCDTGQYTMNLTTHWLGVDDEWAIESEDRSTTG